MRASWRERDLRGGHGPEPSSVGAVVERTHLGLRTARAGEAALLTIAAASITFAVMAFESEAPFRFARVDAWGVALVAGLAAGAAWLLEHRRTLGDVARTLDERLRHQGGLVTAYELERARQADPMARLVSRRVLHRLRFGDAMRCMFPSLAVPVAAPILGIGLLALALERGRAADTVVIDLGALTGGMAEILDGVERGLLSIDEEQEGARGLDDAASTRVLAVARRTRDLERRAELFGERPEEALGELEELDRELAALATELADRPELREELEAARNWIDAARMALGGDESDAGDSSPAEAPTGAVTAGGGDGTMAGSNPATGATSEPATAPGGAETAPEDPEGAPAPAGDASEAGTLAGSWWPAEYDGIVARWIELRRDRDQGDQQERE